MTSVSLQFILLSAEVHHTQQLLFDLYCFLFIVCVFEGRKYSIVGSVCRRLVLCSLLQFD